MLNGTRSKRAEKSTDTTPTVLKRHGITSKVLSPEWLADRECYTTENHCCPCLVYAHTAERLERIAYFEDPLDPSSQSCSGPCWSCCLSSTICNWRGPIREQRQDIRERYGIAGTDDMDNSEACWHPFSTLRLNHDEVYLREKLCRDLKFQPFAPNPPIETRRFKPGPNSPYRSPPQMQMQMRNSVPYLPTINESSAETGRNPPSSPEPSIRSPETATLATPASPESSKGPGVDEYSSPQGPLHKRKDTPARSPDVLRSPVLKSQDTRIVATKFAAPHRLSHDPTVPVGEEPLSHNVYDDPLFGIAQEVQLHSVHDDPTIQVARRFTPHQITLDPKAPISATAPAHGIHDDPTVKVAQQPAPHTVHEDPQIQAVDHAYDHRLSQDPMVVAQNPPMPHSVHDDEIVAIPGAYQPALHSLVRDVQVHEGGKPKLHSVQDDSTVNDTKRNP
ncbi:PLAC8 domain containing protein [Colletotrichum truncatum]|uniref:PLAC8 domain containing protein n=1 Tax=Colletotrichum truncatum TaxID=5467 RepID=A0ACC3ZI16_COLTU|nr:PLAC8 domain containing protein [Colletotrichum truncatum]KAF6786728.1 PLAC8 domain containing protein [Colletotrichum truncatum]